ncbi:hypothetical protein MEME101129_22410 [Methylobacterium mesophilicum]
MKNEPSKAFQAFQIRPWPRPYGLSARIGRAQVPGYGTRDRVGEGAELRARDYAAHRGSG